MPLYHYTCEHAYSQIGEEGHLVPAINLADRTGRIQLMRDPVARLTSQIVWLTTMERPSRFGLGLTSVSLCCDRTRYRYRVTEEETLIKSWSDVRVDWPQTVVGALEALSGCKPLTWWLSRGPVAVEFAPPIRRRSHARVSP